MGILIFLDKYGQEWSLLEESELETYQHLGIPMNYYFKEDKGTTKAGTSKGSPRVGFTSDLKDPP